MCDCARVRVNVLSLLAHLSFMLTEISTPLRLLVFAENIDYRIEMTVTPRSQTRKSDLRIITNPVIGPRPSHARARISSQVLAWRLPRAFFGVSPCSRGTLPSRVYLVPPSAHPWNAHTGLGVQCPLCLSSVAPLPGSAHQPQREQKSTTSLSHNSPSYGKRRKLFNEEARDLWTCAAAMAIGQRTWLTRTT